MTRRAPVFTATQHLLYTDGSLGASVFTATRLFGFQHPSLGDLTMVAVVSRSDSGVVVRALRSAAAFPVAAAAAAAGTGLSAAFEALEGLEGRGRCDNVAAALFNVADPHTQVRALKTRWVSPASRRVAAEGYPHHRLSGVAAGAAGWSGRSAAQNSAPRSVLAAATRRPAAVLRVAAHPGCPATLCGRLAVHHTWDVRAVAAANPRCPAAALVLATEDDDEDVRRAAVSNPSIGAALIGPLSKADNWKVRYAAVSNPSCPQKVLLEWVVGDNDAEVREAATQALQMGAALDRSAVNATQWQIRSAAVAADPRCSAETLTRLAGDDRWQVRVAVASHLRSGPVLLAELAADDDEDVRAAVASNPNCDAETLAELVTDSLAAVRASAASNPECPTAALGMLANDQDTEVLTALAHNPACPDLALRRLLSGS